VLVIVVFVEQVSVITKLTDVDCRKFMPPLKDKLDVVIFPVLITGIAEPFPPLIFNTPILDALRDDTTNDPLGF
jgi:hypothetical protein